MTARERYPTDCSNPCCDRRTFAEPMSGLVARHARRTRRLIEVQGRVGIACGGAPGTRLQAHLRMPASRATVLRFVKAMPMPDAPAPVHVGVDDWAMRKGRSYGTIVVDLDRHRVVDLLPDRKAATLAGWLLQQSDITAVARDRSTEYARVEQDATAKAVGDLACRFTALVRASSVGKAAPASRNALAEFEDWIRKAEACVASAIATFASGLDGGGAAVRAALTNPWSSGQAEGQINRWRLIKCQSYGRAGLDLLQRRMVPTA